jgi:ABC-type transport system involved in multi-copper enzyme maturation permease subunit
MNNTGFRQSTRIILAVATKDITEALRNRTLLTITIGVLVLMLTGPALSKLINRNQPTLVMFAPAGADMFQSLEDRDDLRLVLVDSQEQMNATILQPSQTIIGVVVPTMAGSDPSTGLVLEGYTSHWVTESVLSKRVAFFETALSEASGKSVRIESAVNRLYPSQAESNQFTMISLSLMTMILLMGLALVPYLFIEEKESHTLDALLVSPAHYWQLVVGKLIAGAAYCLIAAAIVLLFNYRFVVHWDVMLITVVLGTAFTVALGLLLGMLFDNAASMGLLTSLLTIVLLVPPLLQTMGGGKIPAALLTAISWLPSSVIYQLIILAMLGEVPIDPVWKGMLLLVGTTLVLCLLVVWRIRQMDR